MKIHLPLETWTDVFGFVPRSQLVEFSPHIHDRQFARVVQFFLHKCGQVTLGQLHITSSRNGNGPIVFTNRELPLAEGPIPSNVVNFKRIRLSYFDPSVRAFLHELQRNGLLRANVNLIFVDPSKDLWDFLTTILPSIVSINFIKLFDLALCQRAYSELVKPMFQKARVLETWDRHSNDWYCEWLYSARKDGKPRLLFLYGSRSISSFIERIKKDFLSPKRAISFFIRVHFYMFPFPPNVQQELQNEETNEKLEIKLIDGEVLISRHPIGANEEWIRKMSKKPYNKYRNITLS